MSNDSGKRRREKTDWDAKKKAIQIAEIAQSKHAEEVVVFQVSELTSLTDFFVICSAESEPQIRAIVDSVEVFLSQKGARPLGVEGLEAGIWVLADYNDVILHIFKREVRDFYNLDRLWGDAPQVPLPTARPSVRSDRGKSNMKRKGKGG